ncbi:hypothetical protein LEMLEM_LOCUS15359 [Lemmus lemmus]
MEDKSTLAQAQRGMGFRTPGSGVVCRSLLLSCSLAKEDYDPLETEPSGKLLQLLLLLQETLFLLQNP